jgi:hypothetical protein
MGIGRKVNKMEEDNSLFQMEIFIKVIGNQEKCMEKDIIAVLQDKDWKEFGNMEI